MTGIVVAVDEQKHKVRVQFPDRDNLVTTWLPVGVQKSKDDYEYWLPDLDTQVACMMDENYEFGVVLCAIYSDVDVPPECGADLHYRKYKDGTVIKYDRKQHKLFADVKGDIEVLATGKADVTIGGKTTWISKGTIDHDGGSGSVKGVVQGDCICPYTRKPHVMISSNVKASK